MVEAVQAGGFGLLGGGNVGVDDECREYGCVCVRVDEEVGYGASVVVVLPPPSNVAWR